MIFGLLFTVLLSETHFLDFDKCLDIAMEQSYAMKRLKEDMLQAELGLKATTRSRWTNIHLGMTAPEYKETMQKFEDSLGVYYTPIKQSIYSSNLIISQPLPSDGEIYFRSGYYSTSDFFRDKNTVQLNTQIGFVQPLEALYSYNKQQSSLKQAQLNYEKSQKRMKREKLNLKYEVSSFFYNLVSSQEQEKIASQTLEYQREANNLAQNKYKAGVIAEVDALQMEIDLAEAKNSYSMAVDDVQAQEDLLKKLLQIDLDDKLKLNYDMTYNKVFIDVTDAIERGLKNRLEIKESEISREIAEINLKKTKVNSHITGDIHGYYDLIGVNQDDIDHNYLKTVEGAFDNMNDKKGNRGISLNISIPVWDWGVNKARINAAKADIRKAEYAIKNEKFNVKLDIRKTVADLQSALRRLELLERNVTVAEKSFEISRKRFANGDIKSQDLAVNRNRLNVAYTNRLNAFITYKLKLADLTRKTFYDYELQQEVVD